MSLSLSPSNHSIDPAPDSSVIHYENRTTSFSLRAYTYILSSDYLYPSNYPVRQVQEMGSIRQSLPVDGINIFERGEAIQHGMIAKIIRAAGRSFTMLLVISLAAPIGTVWHLVLTALHSFCLLFVSRESGKYHWEQTALHMQSFCTDFICAFNLFYLAACTAFPALLEPHLMGGVVFLTAALLFSSGVYPDSIPSYLAWQNERPALVKSIVLKNEYGIVSKENYLLHGDPEKDQEYANAYKKGHFGDLYLLQGLLFLEAVQKLQNELPEGAKLTPHYPPKASSIEGELCWGVRVLLDESGEARSPIDTGAWVSRFKKLENNLESMAALLINCFNQKAYIFGTEFLNTIYAGSKIKTTTYQLPPFPWEPLFCNKFFAGVGMVPSRGVHTVWNSNLEQRIKVLRAGERGLNLEEGSDLTAKEELAKYRDRVLSRATPRVFFNLPPECSHDEVDKAHRKSVIALHPGKFSEDPELTEQAAVLLDCASTAKTVLDKEFESDRKSQ